MGSGRTHSPDGLELESEATGRDCPSGLHRGADGPAVQTLQTKPLLMGETNGNTEGKKSDTRDHSPRVQRTEAAGVDRDRERGKC